MMVVELLIWLTYLEMLRIFTTIFEIENENILIMEW